MKNVCVLVIEPNDLLRDGLHKILGDAGFTVKRAASLSDASGDPDAMKAHLVLWGPGVDPVTVRSELAAVRTRNANHHALRCVALADPSKAMAMRHLAAMDLDAVLLQDISSHVLHRSLELVLLGQRLFPPPRLTTRSKLTARSRVAVAHQDGVVPFVPRGHPGPSQPGPSQPGPSQSGLPQPGPSQPGPSQPGLPQPRPSLAAENAAPKRSRGQVALSNREGRTLACLVDGMRNKCIARELGISEGTVKVHVKALLRKLGVANRTSAAMWAVSNADLVPRPVGPARHGAVQFRAREKRDC